MIGNMESDFRVVKVKNCEAVPKSKKRKSNGYNKT